MKRKREVTCVYFSPGPVLVFLSIFISTINGGEIKVNSGVKYDSGDKGVTVSAGGSLSVNLNSKDVNMDMSSVLQICDFKDRIRIDIVQNRKVSLFYDNLYQKPLKCVYYYLLKDTFLISQPKHKLWTLNENPKLMLEPMDKRIFTILDLFNSYA